MTGKDAITWVLYNQTFYLKRISQAGTTAQAKLPEGVIDPTGDWFKGDPSTPHYLGAPKDKSGVPKGKLNFRITPQGLRMGDGSNNFVLFTRMPNRPNAYAGSSMTINGQTTDAVKPWRIYVTSSNTITQSANDNTYYLKRATINEFQHRLAGKWKWGQSISRNQDGTVSSSVLSPDFNQATQGIAMTITATPAGIAMKNPKGTVTTYDQISGQRNLYAVRSTVLANGSVIHTEPTNNRQLVALGVDLLVDLTSNEPVYVKRLQTEKVPESESFGLDATLPPSLPQPLTLKFVNNLTAGVNVFERLDNNNKYRFSLEGGKTKSQDTVNGKVWVVKDLNNKELTMVVALAAPGVSRTVEIGKRAAPTPTIRLTLSNISGAAANVFSTTSNREQPEFRLENNSSKTVDAPVGQVFTVRGLDQQVLQTFVAQSTTGQLTVIVQGRTLPPKVVNQPNPNPPNATLSQEYRTWLNTPDQKRRTQAPPMEQISFETKTKDIGQESNMFNPSVFGYYPPRMEVYQVNSKRGTNNDDAKIFALPTPQSRAFLSVGTGVGSLAVPHQFIWQGSQSSKTNERGHVFFSEQSRQKAFEAEMSAEAGFGGVTVGVEGNYGSGSDVTESRGKTTVYGSKYKSLFWLTLDKRRIQLDPGFVNDIVNDTAFQELDRETYSRSKILPREYAFFQKYGSDYPLAVLYGGLAFFDEEVNSRKFSELLTDKWGVGTSVEANVLGAEMAVKASYNQNSSSGQVNSSEERSLEVRTLYGSATNFESYDVTRNDQTTGIRLVLRPIYELIRPELFPGQPAQKILARQARIKKAYVDFYRELNQKVNAVKFKMPEGITNDFPNLEPGAPLVAEFTLISFKRPNVKDLENRYIRVEQFQNLPVWKAYMTITPKITEKSNGKFYDYSLDDKLLVQVNPTLVDPETQLSSNLKINDLISKNPLKKEVTVFFGKNALGIDYSVTGKISPGMSKSIEGPIQLPAPPWKSGENYN